MMTTISITDDTARLEGELMIPPGAQGIVVFVHGSGSSRFSPRNNYVAKIIRDRGLGTLLFDLLTRQEDQNYTTRFEISLLTQRLLAATAWLGAETKTSKLKIGYFGASTGAAAALQAAAKLGRKIAAVVSRGGRPDLAGVSALEKVMSPTLLLVGRADDGVIELNEQAYSRLQCKKQLVLIPGATHLFEEPGTLEQVANQAADWFAHYLTDTAA